MSVEASKKDTFTATVARLQEAVTQQKPQGVIGTLIRDATIQRFEFTLETAWKYMRYLLLQDGVLREDVASPRKTIQTAFANSLISDTDTWLEMLRHRNSLAHTYNEAEACVLEENIKGRYLGLFEELLRHT
ncbi:MAG: nucleotidyltransferase substrate binding protein [Defluviitaleaceae bacterium]|nr:nucleotidyltransferase substrate binding protein [Defluviitaleaceae bacterium]